ncbi:MAG: hypothetical protein UU87_C0003G0008 [Parcubacteria group bacterium GW2011_GWA2_42_11]|nr:MAG: hypothetical protein UU87_C0003G0008 [Parcubacteria group bacterium GW2011_GWA2_42_11]
MKKDNQFDQKIFSSVEKTKGMFFIPEIYLTNRCNQNCLFCSVQANSPNNNLKESAWEEIKNDVADIKKFSSQIKFSGGEATIRQDFFDIINLAKTLGFEKITVESNGQSFSDWSFASQAIAAGANDFFISFHGHTAALQDKITGIRGSFSRTKQGLENLIKLGRPPMINVVINRLNYRYLPQIVSLLARLGINMVTLSFIMMEGNAASQPALVPEIKKVVSYLRLAIKQSPSVRIGLQHFPFCLLGDLNRYNFWFKVQHKKIIDNPNFRIIIEPKNERDSKDKKCLACRYEKICPGLRKSYADHYGFKEIHPLPGRQFKNIKDYLEYYFKKYHPEVNRRTN